MKCGYHHFFGNTCGMMSDGRGWNIKWFVGVHLFPNQANGKLVARNPGVLDFFGIPFPGRVCLLLGEIFSRNQSKAPGPVVHHSLTRWWFQIFFIFTPNLGEMIQFDEHILQMGWFNHHSAWHLVTCVMVGIFFSIWQPQKLGEGHRRTNRQPSTLGQQKGGGFSVSQIYVKIKFYLTPKGIAFWKGPSPYFEWNLGWWNLIIFARLVDPGRGHVTRRPWWSKNLDFFFLSKDVCTVGQSKVHTGGSSPRTDDMVWF